MMKIHIEKDLPRWLSRAILVVIPPTIAAIGTWVYAGVPTLCSFCSVTNTLNDIAKCKIVARHRVGHVVLGK
jgi:hypothetical protein